MLKQNNSNAGAPQNMNITIGNTECKLLLDSGSGCTIINMSLAKHIMFNCIQMVKQKPLKLKSFSNDTVETLGTLETPVHFNDWQIQRADVTVVIDRLRPI